MDKKIGYLGPEGSYSQLAAEKLKAKAQPVPYSGFYQLVKALKGEEIDFAVLPIENSLNGGVMQNIDLLQQTEGIIAVKEAVIKIDHRLVTQQGAKLEDIKRVYSHAQALGQCTAYLSENLPEAKLIETSSTSGSVSMIKTAQDAAIAGAHCSCGDLQISSESVSDEKNNYTQFLLITRGCADELASCKKIYFSVTCLHEPGALMRLLAVLDKYSLNMTKIESRPIKDRVGEYRFFIEMEADYSSPDVKKAIEGIKAISSSFKLLGCY